MTTIHVLPPELVTKIAAGEVIERPAFVVKELVENAIDAEATQISIEVTKGGLESIVVADNGVGMSASDLFLAWQRHTTSKLLPDSDLTNIQTLGFRGEALASITAVSDVTLQSRRAQDPGGNKVTISHGKLLESDAVGMAPGTIVKVEQIFVGLPARRKFLSSAQTEWQQCIHIIEAQTLAHPEIRFVVKHNGKLILDVPKQSQPERLAAVLGTEVAAESFPFDYQTDAISIQGFLGTPQLSFHTNIPSYFIVNHRVIKNKALSQAIKESYRGLLKVEATPFFLLYLQVPSEMIDVNIHPRKEEIKFLNEAELCQKVVDQILALTNRQSLSYRWSTPKGDTKSFAAAAVKSDVVAGLKKISSTTPIIQLHNLYLVTQTDQGVLLIDQHAAHERILYEKLSESYVQLQKNQKTIHLPKPKKLSLPLSQVTLLEDNLATLESLGFIIGPASAHAYLIHAVPAFFQDRNILQLFQEILADLDHQTALSEIDKHTNRMLAFLACRLAIKAGDKLDDATIRELIRDLSLTKTAYTCPHGRPTHIEFSLLELEKAFGRK
jgi:DNA mismatch repair protein MutL